MRTVLPVFRFVVREDKKSDGVAFVQCMECVPPLVAVDDELGCINLRRAAAENGKNEADVDRLEGENNRSALKERFAVVSFNSVLSTVYVGRASIAVQRLTTELRQNRHRSRTTDFFPESGMSRKRVHDQGNIYCNTIESVRKEIYGRLFLLKSQIVTGER